MKNNNKMVDACFNSQSFNLKQTIQIYSNKLTSENLLPIVEDIKIKQVRILILGYCQFQPLAVNELSKGNWEKLEVLSLYCNKPFENEGCKQIAKMQAKNLRKISLNGNQIGPAGCRDLAKANWLKIQTINFGGNKIADEGCNYLASSGWNLTQVYLKSNKIGEYGVKLLSQCNWSQLYKINLSGNLIRDTGCKWMSQSHWPNLKELSLVDTKFFKAGCRWLSKANWKQINTSNLRCNKMYWEGWRYLSHCDRQDIQKLSACYCSIKQGRLKWGMRVYSI